MKTNFGSALLLFAIASPLSASSPPVGEDTSSDRYASYMAARCSMAMGMVARSLARTPEERAEGDRMVNTLLLAARGFGVSASEVDGWVSEFGKELAAAQYSADFLQTEAGACMSFMGMREQDLKLAAQRTCDSLEPASRPQECK